MQVAIPERFQSRKFIVALAAVVAIAFGVNEDALSQVIPVLLTYLGGQSAVDALSALKKK